MAGSAMWSIISCRSRRESALAHRTCRGKRLQRPRRTKHGNSPRCTRGRWTRPRRQGSEATIRDRNVAGPAAREPQLGGGAPRVSGRSGAATEEIMTTVTYGDAQGSLIATVEAPDELKEQLFNAYLAKTPWLVQSRWYEIRGML